MLKRIVLIGLISFLFFPSRAVAQDSSLSQTIVINQVRGSSCCDLGSVDHFQNQVGLFSNLEMPATFTLRYDTLSDASFLSVIESSPKLVDYGAFLEIIPGLAEDAGVPYFGDGETWYEAQHAFLIGYSQDDRKKLIDTYMAKYVQVFDTYPKVTTAWMIDAWSLQYLKSEYGVLVHQITREQYGTDSYALYGGPAHYPYWPSDNWALIPSENGFSETMPLIVRQTVTDPVENYGDDSSLHTSQPNDYLQDPQQNSDYFVHLFSQAHQQPMTQPTFTLLGLENSMDQLFQDEFKQQLEYVDDWRQQSSNNQVISATALEDWYKSNATQTVSVYSGSVYQNQNSRAWWITTPFYRARLRLDQNQLYISDLRLYDQSFSDPYLDSQAQNLGWWIVPFVLDGSRFFYDQPNPEPNQLALDALVDRKKDEAEPTRIEVASQVNQLRVEFNKDLNQLQFVANDQLVAIFSEKDFSLASSAQYQVSHPWLDNTTQDLKWIAEDGTALWGFEIVSENDDLKKYQAVVNQSADLSQERDEHYPLLFPELTNRPLDIEKTYLYTNNQYAIVGRNPVRLVLFPRDEYDSPTLLETEPEVSSQQELDSITLKRQHGNSGMVFIDFENQKPLSTEITVNSGDFFANQTIYFAPNCKQEWVYCLTHPRQASWYVQAVIDDRKRAQEEVN